MSVKHRAVITQLSAQVCIVICQAIVIPNVMLGNENEVLEMNQIEFRRDMEFSDLNTSQLGGALFLSFLNKLLQTTGYQCQHSMHRTKKTISSHHHSQVHIDTVTQSKMMNQRTQLAEKPLDELPQGSISFSQGLKILQAPCALRHTAQAMLIVQYTLQIGTLHRAPQRCQHCQSLGF